MESYVMDTYYAIETENVKGFILLKGKIQRVSLKEVFELYLTDGFSDEKQYEKFKTPKHIILEKIEDDFYEIYTGTKISNESDYDRKASVFYTSKNIASHLVGPSEVGYNQLYIYAEQWIDFNDLKVEALKKFFKDAKIYIEAEKEMNPHKKNINRLYRDKIIEEFNKTLVKTKKIRK